MLCYSFPFESMRSRCAVHLFARQKSVAEAVAESAIAEVVRVEAKYSRYLEGSATSGINRAAAAGTPISVDLETTQLLNMAFRLHRLSGGLFDVTSGILRRAWDFSSRTLPSGEAVRTLLPWVGMGLLRWKFRELAFSRPGLELDFGGIGKEYAADRAAGVCRRMGMEHALVDLGGDLAVVGPLPDGSPWTIHVRHPLRRGDALLAVDVSRGGIATSGDYERCIEFEGRRYSHILNPTNGFPVQAMASTTVVAASCRLAGALSTTAMLMEDRAPAWLAGTDRLHAWVATDGRVGGTLFDGHSGQQAEL